MQRGDQGKFFKNRPKSSLCLKGARALWRKWHYLLISMHLKCKHWRRFWHKKRLQRVPEWPSDGNFLQGHPKPAFSKKVQRGDQEKFFKNRPRSSPCLKGPKALSRQSHYPLISMHLICKDWRRFWRKQRLADCPNNHVMAILARSPKTRIF